MRTRANILSAAFDIFGEEQGLFARIEDIATAAGITRATFYNHFSGMGELREALSYEVTHDFLAAVTHTISRLPDARKRAAVAVRFCLNSTTNAMPRPRHCCASSSMSMRR